MRLRSMWRRRAKHSADPDQEALQNDVAADLVDLLVSPAGAQDARQITAA
jgi:hypothetical protein